MVGVADALKGQVAMAFVVARGAPPTAEELATGRPPAASPPDWNDADRRIDARLFEAIPAVLDCFAVVRLADEARMVDHDHCRTSYDPDGPLRASYDTMGIFNELHYLLTRDAATACIG